MSEIEEYATVRIGGLPEERIAGFAADDISHLLAELLENAVSCSPPHTPVEISGRLLESGEILLAVEDRGIGMPDDRVAALNALLADPAASAGGTPGLGLYVVARLATRLGVSVRLSARPGGGVSAVAAIPAHLVAPAIDPDGPQTPVEAAAIPRPALPEVPEAPEVPEVPDEPVEVPGDDTAYGARAAAPDGGPVEHPAPEPPARAANVPAPNVPAPNIPAAHTPSVPPQFTRPDAPGTGYAGQGAPGQGGAAHPGAAERPATVPAQHARSAAPAPAPAPEHAEHARGADGPERAAPPAAPVAGGFRADDSVPGAEEAPFDGPLTAKGLPRRVPRSTGLNGEPATRPAAVPAVDAEALRRRLGGFQQGLREGRRDSDAETAELRTRGLAAVVSAEGEGSAPDEGAPSPAPSPAGPVAGVEEAHG
jgi:hypothetical protein